jgi:excisionase family DNA binding protein
MPRDEDDLPDLLTTMDVARIFRVARSTVSGWAGRGLLPYTRTPSGRIRFYRDDVNRLLAEQHHDARATDE